MSSIACSSISPYPDYESHLATISTSDASLEGLTIECLTESDNPILQEIMALWKKKSLDIIEKIKESETPRPSIYEDFDNIRILAEGIAIPSIETPTLVCKKGDVIEAVAIYTRNPSNYDISLLMTNPKNIKSVYTPEADRVRGAAFSLMRHISKEAFLNKASVSLMVMDSDRSARFYYRAGFRSSGSEKVQLPLENIVNLFKPQTNKK
jgi:hypothetical protein